jgi:DNA polymerase III subunit chi
MTEVDFHFNAPDKQAYACRLLRKAYLKGARLVVVTDPDSLASLDAALWTFAADAFLPHSREGDTPYVEARSPIRLYSEVPVNPGGDATVLVNLRSVMPDGYQAYRRIIEVVSTDPRDRDLARPRWMQYRSAGIEPRRHDLLLAAQD